jgi:hypothetical protein
VQINGEILAKIVSYNLTNHEKIAIQNNEFVNLSTKMSSTTVDPSTFSIQQLTARIECHDEERQVVEACSSLKHDESNMELWHQCTATVKPKVYIILTTVCEDVSSGGGDNGGSSGLPGDSGAGSNTGGEPIGSIDDINDEPITTPLLNVSPVRTFIAGLNAEESQWWNEVATTETKALLENYLNQNTVDNVLLDEAEQFALQFIQNSLSSGLNLDFEKSLKSPANIDISNFEDETEDEERILNCTIDKLMKSSNFKNLYNSIFGANDDRINFKIEIGDLPNNKGGQTHAQYNGLNGQVNNLFNTITISRDRILNTSTLYLANIIIHEMIHAYLNIQRANLGEDIYNLNNYDTLGDFLVSNQPIATNNTNIDTHTFMFQNMIPVFVNIYNQILNELVNQSEIEELEGSDILDPISGEFYESWNVQNLLFYLSTTGLDKNHDGTIVNLAYANEIGNFPNKYIPRNYYYLLNARDSFTKKCQ